MPKLSRVFHDFFYQLWYVPFSSLNLTQKIIFNILTPFSVLFQIGVGLRRVCYQKGIFKSYAVKPFVWVIGNLTVGGNGKTPCVIASALYMKAKGVRVGIVSRGYGRRGTGSVCLEINSTANEVGDEALLIFQKTGCPVAIGRNRVQAVQALLQKHPDLQLIISDDGLQHYTLKRDAEWVLVNPETQFGNGHLLPQGPLREPLSRLGSVDFCLSDLRLKPEKIYSLFDPQHTQEPEAFNKETVHAIAGIAHPDRFFNTLRTLGMVPIKHPFPDHATIQIEEWLFDDQKPVFTTEKDAVKCPLTEEQAGPNQYWVIAVEMTTTPQVITQWERIRSALTA